MRLLLLILFLICDLQAYSQEGETYRDKEDHFAFDSPSDYRFQSELDPSRNFVFGGLRDAKGKWLLEVDIVDSSAYHVDIPGLKYDYYRDPTFENFALYQAQLRCDADGPDGSTYLRSRGFAQAIREPSRTDAVLLSLNKVDEPAMCIISKNHTQYYAKCV